MYLYYNGLWFDANEAEIVLSRRRTYNQYRRLQQETHVWNVSGVRHAASQSALTTSLNTFESYMQDGGDIGLYLDDQATLTSHYIVNDDTVGGTRIVDVSYPKGTGAEYSTFRTWSFTLEADFAPSVVGSPGPIEFQESLTFEGGDPRHVWLETAVGLPQKQTVSQYTTFRATQQGSARQIGSPPTVPPACWPDYLMGRRLGKVTQSGASLEFSREWTYSFESDRPLFAEPHFVTG